MIINILKTLMGSVKLLIFKFSNIEDHTVYTFLAWKFLENFIVNEGFEKFLYKGDEDTCTPTYLNSLLFFFFWQKP